ncbi:hypothetical protein [Comamonas aquatica]|uniref:hypothetical protein n=1 Tax=Comamonas aquatica TaxID=225991 RepID=UPI001B397548|nr:hypothetical protein KAQ61_09760 [Comamonas aquatica]
MLISLHKNATTTPATRLALQQASGTDRELAQQYGIGIGVGSRTIGCLKTSVRCCMAERYCKQFWQHGNPVPRSCHADQPSQERYDHTCHPFGIAASQWC